jgi:hypothetical protein
MKRTHEQADAADAQISESESKRQKIDQASRVPYVASSSHRTWAPDENIVFLTHDEQDDVLQVTQYWPASSPDGPILAAVFKDMADAGDWDGFDDALSCLMSSTPLDALRDDIKARLTRNHGDDVLCWGRTKRGAVCVGRVGNEHTSCVYWNPHDL